MFHVKHFLISQWRKIVVANAISYTENVLAAGLYHGPADGAYNDTTSVADLEGADPAPAPLLGDGPTPSLYSW